MEGAGLGLGDRLLEGELRDVHELARAVVFPAVIAADDVAVLHPALGQLGGAVAAPVLERDRRAAAVLEQHDRSPSSVNGFGPSSRSPTGMTAYQKRRSTGWRVASMVQSLNTRPSGPTFPSAAGVGQSVFRRAAADFFTRPRCSAWRSRARPASSPRPSAGSRPRSDRASARRPCARRAAGARW